MDGLRRKAVTAVLRIIRVDHRLIPARLRQRKRIALPQHRAEVEHGDHLTPAPADAPEGHNRAVPVIAAHPLEAAPVRIVLPHGRMFQIKLIECPHIFLHLSVSVIAQQQPVEPLREVPFDKLRKLIAHEAELFSGMGHLICVKHAQIVEFIIIVARHLVDE